jgi:CBS domain containing-hemolysin-like protein
MRFGIQVTLAGLSALALVFLSTVQSAYEQTSDVGLRILRGEARSDRHETFFDELMENWLQFQMALRLGIYIAVVGIAVIAVRVTSQLGVPRSQIVAFAAALVLVFVCRQFVPLLVSQNNPERVLIGLLPFFKPYYRAVSVLVGPVVWLLKRTRREEQEQTPVDADDDHDTTMTDIQALIDVGAEEGIIEEAEGLMIQSIVEFGDRVVSEVMTPRAQVVAIRAAATVLEARDIVMASKHSRLPVYRDGLDDIEGVIYVRDLIGAWAEGRENEPVTEVMRPAYFVPEVKLVADLLEDMRKSKVQIALVIDEYGSVAGIVTIEDLLEEIVGEIEDEDVQVAVDEDIVETQDGMLVKGSADIRKLEVLFDTELEADDFTTVAGLVISELGHLPSPGERMTFKNLEFEVLEADDRRVNLVRLRQLPEPASDTQQEATQTG